MNEVCSCGKGEQTAMAANDGTTPHCASRCLGCGASELIVVEKVSIDDLARAWARDREVAHQSVARIAGPGGKADAWQSLIFRALGSEVVMFRECRCCGLQMSDPAKAWPEGLYPADEHYPLRWEFSRFLTDLGTNPCRVLELGCGTGRFLEEARSRGHRVLGIDFSQTAVEAARRKGLEVVHGGIEQLRAYLDARGQELDFDAVAIFHVIEHLPEPGPLFRKLHRFVRPGGLLAVSCPGPNRFTRLIRVQQVCRRDFWDYPPHHVLRWTGPALRHFLQRCGWESVMVAEEPLCRRDAAAQMGVTRALWKGYARERWRTRWSILRSRLRLMASPSAPRGLSLYALAARPQTAGVAE
jgi:SAM-dependent methyltransferase